MDKCVILIDNSNVFIEGQKFSAKQKGFTGKNEFEKDYCDPSWRIDFGNLIHEIANGLIITKAILVGSTPPASDSIWEAAKKSGFEVTTHERSSSGKEKAVDTELVAKGTEIICLSPEPQVLKLLSGDRDFIPLIGIANRRSWETEMWAFTSSFSFSGEMAQSVTTVKTLDSIFTNIGMNAFTWP
jgi:uncharacterized LabA/DUF88 family protein